MLQADASSWLPVGCQGEQDESLVAGPDGILYLKEPTTCTWAPPRSDQLMLLGDQFYMAFPRSLAGLEGETAVRLEFGGFTRAPSSLGGSKTFSRLVVEWDLAANGTLKFARRETYRLP